MRATETLAGRLTVVSRRLNRSPTRDTALTMNNGEEYHRRAQAAEAHADKSLGITRAHFIESAKQWSEKAHDAGYRPVVEKARRAPRKTAATPPDASPSSQT